MTTPKYSDDDLKRVAGIKDEIFNDKLNTVLEVVVDIQKYVRQLPTMQEDIAELKGDVKVIKAAVTDTNRDIQKLEKRVTHLEVA